MEEFPPTLDLPPAAPLVRRTSLAARLLNIVAMPGLVFEEIKTARHMAGNWLVPALIASIVGVTWALVAVSQPAFQTQMQDGLTQLAKTMDSHVKSGEISRQAADQWITFLGMVTRPTVLKVLGTILAVAAGFGRVFGWAFVLWLISLLFLKIKFSYVKAMEVVGLASMIAVLGTVVSILLIVNVGSLFSAAHPEPVGVDFTLAGKNQWVANVSEVFNFWYLGVMSCGLARLTGVPFLRAMFLLLTFWVLLVLALTVLAGLKAGGS